MINNQDIYSHSLSLLSSLNNAKINHKPINDFFIYKDWDLWAGYQARIFHDLSLGDSKKIDKKEQSFSLKGRIVLSLMAIYSFFSIIIASFKKLDVVLYSVDLESDREHLSDKRISHIYEFLKKEKINFLEIFHTIPNKKSLFRMIRRLRPAIYLESIGFFSKFFVKNITKNIPDNADISNLGEADTKVRVVLKKYLERKNLSIFLIKRIKRILNILKPKYFWSIDDARHTSEILVACGELGIKSSFFQHGHYTKYQVGFFNYSNSVKKIPKPDYLVLWSEYWMGELLRLNSIYKEDQIFVSGYPNYPKIDLVIKNKKPDVISVLIPYETVAPKAEVKEYIKELEQEGIKIVFKVRQDMDEGKQMDEYGLSRGATSVIKNIEEAVKDSDIVAGVYSTFLYDMIPYGIPVAILKTSMDYEMGMVQNGIAGLIDLDLKNLKSQIKSIIDAYPKKFNEIISKISTKKEFLIEAKKLINL